MYLEILHDAVAEYLKDEKASKQPIELKLTPELYKMVQIELNGITTFNTEVPIEGADYSSIKLYQRGIKLILSDQIDSKVERALLRRYTEFFIKSSDGKTSHLNID